MRSILTSQTNFSANQPNRYNGKELDRKNGLDWLDYGARHNPGHGQWTSPDPLAEKYYDWSPYVYCVGNPIKFVDPDGRKVVIYGEDAISAFEHLSASTSLRLSMQNDGSLKARGKAKSDADKLLLEAINSSDIIVQVEAVNSNYTPSGNALVGAGFRGNEVVDGVVKTSQIVNPNQLKALEEFYGLENGVNMMHEVLESYIGGKDHPDIGTGDLVNSYDERYKDYVDSHNKAKTMDKRHVNPDINQDADGFWMNKTVLLPSGKKTTIRTLLNDLRHGL